MYLTIILLVLYPVFCLQLEWTKQQVTKNCSMKVATNYQIPASNWTVQLNQLHGRKISKSAGIHNIPLKLLKDGAFAIGMPLTMIINRTGPYQTLSQSTVPAEWKTAKVTPMLKKVLTTWTTTVQTVQRAVHTKLCEQLRAREHKILSPYQFWFGKGHSTELYTLTLYATTSTKDNHLVQYLSIWQMHLIQLIIRYYFKNCSLLELRMKNSYGSTTIWKIDLSLCIQSKALILTWTRLRLVYHKVKFLDHC